MPGTSFLSSFKPLLRFSQTFFWLELIYPCLELFDIYLIHLLNEHERIRRRFRLEFCYLSWKALITYQALQLVVITKEGFYILLSFTKKAFRLLFFKFDIFFCHENHLLASITSEFIVLRQLRQASLEANLSLNVSLL